MSSDVTYILSAWQRYWTGRTELNDVMYAEVQ